MFKLDPHCDPASDGENVFIIGLLSDVVLTFTPPDSAEGSRLSVAAGVYRGNVRIGYNLLCIRPE
jgi:hypothetical protein